MLITFFFHFQNQNSSTKLNGGIKEQFQRTHKDEMSFFKQQNNAYMTKLIAAQQQQHQHHQQQQQKRLIQDGSSHNTLARTTSVPVSDSTNQTVSNLFSSLNDILNGGTTANIGHRKLERTQSEPIPQTNTSR